MTTQSQSVGLRAAVRRAWRFSPLLTLSILVSLALLPMAIAAAFLNPVQIGGVNGWTKPIKFLISVPLYSTTLLWMLTLVASGRRWVRWVAGSVGALLLAEHAIIILQVLRGRASHFNMATPLDAALFSAMGMMIALLALLNLVVAVWLLRQRLPDPVLAAGLRWAIWLTCGGMLVAFLMTTPTAAQRAALASGAPLTIAGAHSVGAPDGGPGLPLLGWSTTSGDLRVPHFVGLHALQVLPLVAWALRRRWAARRWSVGRRTALVHVAGLGYAGLFALVTWQALRGQPLLSPDALTLTTGALLLASVAAATLLLLGPDAAQPERGLADSRPA